MPITSDLTPRLALPLLAAAQAQKHVTVNEALVNLDRIVHLAVDSRSIAVPPAAPQPGARFAVPPGGAAGAWAGRESTIAVLDESGNWDFVSPGEGWLIWCVDEGALLVWSADALRPAAPEMLERLGIATSADAGNPLAVAGPATLFTHDAGGTHQLKINKANAAATASVLFQTGYSGRAEFGCAGNDRFSLKVSADGTSWATALDIDPATAVARFPGDMAQRHNLLANPAFTINQRGFVSGSLSAGAYGPDRWRASGGAAQLAFGSDHVILSSGKIEQIVEPAAFGLAGFSGRPLTFGIELHPDDPVRVTIGAVVHDLAAGEARRMVHVVMPSSQSGPLPVRIETNGAPVRLNSVALVAGTGNPWIAAARSQQDELALCRRYYALIGSEGIELITGGSPAGVIRAVFPVEMRTNPSLSLIGSTATFVIPAYAGIFTATPVLTSNYLLNTRTAIIYSVSGFLGPPARVSGWLSQPGPMLAADAEF